VSVVIPTYNCARLLPLAVESAFDQTLPPDEVVVVDDGSTDGTAALLGELSARYGARLTCLRQPNGGEARARNTGVAAARHELVAFLDQDDRWTPEKLETQVEELLSHPEADLVFCAYWRLTPAGDRALVCLPAWKPEPVHAWHSLIIGSCMTPSTVVVRKRALQAVGGFDESLRVGCDWDMWLRLAISGIQTRYLSTPLVEYLWHDGNLSGDRRAVSAAAQAIFSRLFRRKDLPAAFRAHERWCRARWHLIHAENSAEAGDAPEATRQIVRAMMTMPWAVRPGWFRILAGGLAAGRRPRGQEDGLRKRNSPQA
jgi:glycosyltransferase involved in cell wall biosynthesis